MNYGLVLPPIMNYAIRVSLLRCGRCDRDWWYILLDTWLESFLFYFLRDHRESHFLVQPTYHHRERLAGLDGLTDMLCGMDGLTVDADDHVPVLDAGAVDHRTMAAVQSFLRYTVLLPHTLIPFHVDDFSASPDERNSGQKYAFGPD